MQTAGYREEIKNLQNSHAEMEKNLGQKIQELEKLVE